MKRRQRGTPRQWLVADHRLGEKLWAAIRRLPRGSGVLFLFREMPVAERARLKARLRRLARLRELIVAEETEGGAARVHNHRELRRALLAGRLLIFLSPLFATRSHPDWRPLPKMRAATLARLARRPVIALGGMNAKRFRHVGRLGFHGWAGIDTWLSSRPPR